ncbi:MAG: sporulation protein, partial [Chloroflexota bacterium]
EVRTVETSVQLAYETPLTIGGNSVYVKTGLDIPLALDPQDRDAIEVMPGTIVQGIFDAMEGMGFRFYRADCEQGYFKYNQPYVQEFEFRPQTDPFRAKLDEVEFVCLPGPESTQVYMQVDRRGRGVSGLFADMLDTDETNLKLELTQQDVPTIKERLAQTILSHAG